MKPTSLIPIINDWREKCTRKNKLSRNTIAVGIVVLDHLRHTCPVTREDLTTAGGEIRGARSGLARILQKYGIPPFLKEVTTRQAAHDGLLLLEMLGFGEVFETTTDEERDGLIVEGISMLGDLVTVWLSQQHLKVNCDRQLSPVAWIAFILEQASERSGGKVEQHLVGAKLEKRFPEIEISNLPSHAADLQTGRAGDFAVGTTIYHVTVAPSRGVIEKCGANLAAGLHPTLLVPRSEVSRAEGLATYEDLHKRISILAIEDFIALNIVEMAEGRGRDFADILRRLVEIYNRRLAAVETDMSLQIEIA